jgi:hypothetical protein
MIIPNKAKPLRASITAILFEAGASDLFGVKRWVGISKLI